MQKMTECNNAAGGDASTTVQDASSSDSIIEITESKDAENQPYVAKDTPATATDVGNCGLYNLGNTCYMNSVIQCLMHSPSLLPYFSEAEFSCCSGLLYEFQSLCKKYWSGKWSVIVPSSFKNLVCETHSQFSGNSQHDGQEFLALFLESLHQEIKKFLEKTVKSQVCRLPSNGVDDSGPTDDVSKRKRSKNEHLAINCPNNKRFNPSPSLTNNFLELNSFICKEKKMQNVNVLNTDVECDEEITTDHSNKYPQMVGSRLNNGEFFDSSRSAEQPSQRKEAIESLPKSVTDSKFDKLKKVSSKQTNLLAEIKRQGTSSTPNLPDRGRKVLEHETSYRGDKARSTCGYESDEEILCKKQMYSGDLAVLTGLSSGAVVRDACRDRQLFVGKSTFKPALYQSFEAESIVGNSYQSIVGNGGYYSDGDDLYDEHMLRRSVPVSTGIGSTVAAQFLTTGGRFEMSFRRKKIFSLRKHDYYHRKGAVVTRVFPANGCDSNGADSNSNNASSTTCLLENDASCGLQSISGDRSSLVEKLTNILVEEDRDREDNNSETEMDDSEAKGDNASNIRGDICGQSPNNLSVAEEMWNKYMEKNNSVVVGNFQGQLESVVTCRKCGEKSVTYEPLMYLSVPIPHALQASYDLWIVPLEGSATCQSVYVSKQGRVQDLKNALAETLEDRGQAPVDLTRYALCEMKDNRIHRVLENTAMLKCLDTKACHLELLEVLDASTAHTDEDAPRVQTSWNSCCICLEDFADTELMEHSAESCTIMICHACLQASAEHYGFDEFSCPICHKVCSPANDFRQLADSSQSRDVIVSVNFTFVDGYGYVKAAGPPGLVRTATVFTRTEFFEWLQKLAPRPIATFDNFELVSCTLNGAACSRCNLLPPCVGCAIPADDRVVLQPGDNIALRLTKAVLGKLEPLVEPRRCQETPQVTLDMCLEAFTKNEILDDSNPWYCPSCCGFQSAEKQMRICRWPKTLILYIKRFLYQSEKAIKVDDEVVFPLDSFDPSSIRGVTSSHVGEYDLTACISHFGGVYSGHYTAHCKHNATGKWHLYNDENVSPLEPSTKDSSSVYVLFYEQRR